MTSTQIWLLILFAPVWLAMGAIFLWVLSTILLLPWVAVFNMLRPAWRWPYIVASLLLRGKLS